METFANFLLDLLSQFGGGRGDIKNELVRFGLGTSFWSIILLVTVNRLRIDKNPREKILVWGFSIGLLHQFMMFAVTSIAVLGFIEYKVILGIFAPFDLLLANLTLLVVSSAFMFFIVGDLKQLILYLNIGIILLFISLVISVVFWINSFAEIYTGGYSYSWSYLLSHVLISLILIYPISIIIQYDIGWKRRAIVTGLLFYMINEIILILVFFEALNFINILIPLGNNFYIFAIPLFGYVYLRELTERTNKAYSRVNQLSDDLVRINREQENYIEKLKRMAVIRDKLLQRFEDARYMTLQERMNPHFIYNAIHTIHALIHKNPDKADLATIKLSEIFHFLTDRSFESMVLFHEEWTFMMNFLEFEMIRFPDVLQYETRKNGDFENVMIPPMTIQPLVENSIKHGIRQRSGMGFINVKAEREGDKITVSVSDNGTTLKEKNPFDRSLGNIRDRLHYYYESSDLEISNRNEGGVEAVIKINLSSLNIR
jgi:sensor histidine kinase YesM